MTYFWIGLVKIRLKTYNGHLFILSNQFSKY